MTINTLFIPAFSIEDVLLDKDTGEPMAGGIVTFYDDSQRGNLKPVYQITGTSPNYTFIALPNPMVLSSIGTFVDALGNPVVPYFYPYDDDGNIDYYYVVVENANLVPQFDRESVPYVPESGSSILSNSFTNELSNPQFAVVNFGPVNTANTYNLTAGNNQVVNIGPNWDVVVSCSTSAAISVTQLADTGSLNIPTNAGTLLKILVSGIGVSSAILRQRITGSPNLWGNGWLAASFVASTYTGLATNLFLQYSQSNGIVVNQPIVNAELTSDGNLNSFAGTLQLPVSNNTDIFPNAYIDIDIILPLGSQIAITSVMVNSTGQVAVENIVYDQETNNRQLDHLFHYYEPQLAFKPIPSLLVGWDFPLNPAQLGTAPGSAGTTPSYIWDQTILQSAVGTITVSRNTNTGNLQLVTTNAMEAISLIQYIGGSRAFETTMSYLATNLNIYASAANVAVNVQMFYSSNSGTIPTLPTTIGTTTYSSGLGVFTLSGGSATTWTPITQTLGYPNATTVPTSNKDIGFVGYNGLANFNSSSTTHNFAIVVTFGVPTSATTININSISCVPGMIATRPAPQSFDAVMRECEHFYEMTYPTGTTPGMASSYANILTYPMERNNSSSFFASAFSIEFGELKRAIPVLSIYSPVSGSINNVAGWVMYPASSNSTTTDLLIGGMSAVWTSNWVITAGSISVSTLGNKGVSFYPLQYTSVWNPTASNLGSISLHYTADARYGVVS